MKNEQIIELLAEQLRLVLSEKQILMEQLHRQSIQIEEQQASIRSLEEALLIKNGNILTLTNKNRGLGKLISNKSEKIPPTVVRPDQTPDPEQPSLRKVAIKERGNNQAKRKEFFDLETIVEDVYPDDPRFDKEKANIISYTDSILYEYIPGRFIKRIYRQYNCRFEEKLYSGNAPKSPLLNSNYDASFMAGMLQLRYIYSMPVERIVKFFAENGFEINKATAHGLIKKSAWMMEQLDKALKKEILTDDYLSMDESYYTILTKEKNQHGKGVRKGYIWAALANGKKLIQFFYENGSRSREVLTNYIGEQYRGAIQSDGLANYKILETDTYPAIIRLGCFQHCKRKFLDIERDKDAQEVVDVINEIYQVEHKMGKDWKPEQILRHRQKYVPPILKKLKDKLLQIQSDPGTLPKSPLAKAAAYTLTEYDALSNYILRHDYFPDNNAVERQQRYISLSRKNSLFCGSHAGAERTALIYSLACSCRLNGINTFEYFTDVLNRLATISPNAPDEVFQELLPNRWVKK